jgi:hypothetical protein
MSTTATATRTLADAVAESETEIHTVSTSHLLQLQAEGWELRGFASIEAELDRRAADQSNPRFQHMVSLEARINAEYVSIVCGIDGATRGLATLRKAKAQRELYALVSDLGPKEGAAYAEYRRTAYAG